MSLLDENRAVLAQIAEAGSDLTEPRQIDFEHVFPNEQSALAFANLGSANGYSTNVWLNEEGEWNVTANATLLPTAEEITRVEELLDQLAQSNSGKADGWGFYRTN